MSSDLEYREALRAWLQAGAERVPPLASSDYVPLPPFDVGGRGFGVVRGNQALPAIGLRPSRRLPPLIAKGLEGLVYYELPFGSGIWYRGPDGEELDALHRVLCRQVGHVTHGPGLRSTTHGQVGSLPGVYTTDGPNLVPFGALPESLRFMCLRCGALLTGPAP